MEEKHLSLEESFKNPPNEFRMMPFWFWNHEMIEKEIVRQIHDHRDHGIGGEFIHPRHGRLTPYMGQRWLETVEAAADKCKEYGMFCFLYDEDNWPSGSSGGYITGPYRPENRAKFIIVFDEEVFEGPKRITYDLDYVRIPEAKFYAAIATPNPEAYPDFSGVIGKQVDLSAFVQGNTLVWDVPEGAWSVVFFCMVVNPPDSNLNGYIDVLRKDTVQDFINFTHKRYAEWFINHGKAGYLGTVVPGIFTDEPSMAHMAVPEGRMVPWITFTQDMPRRFKKMFGYEFNVALLSLFYTTGAISAKHRCNYWECATDMYVNAFYKPIYEFCDRYNLRTTGHVNSEGSFPSHIKNQGDFFKVFEYMHYGGVDQLTEDVRPDGIEELWNLDKNPYSGMANEMVTASKLASSAAHLLGKPRVLVESYGTSAWDITMASTKRVTDFLIATGCDLFVPHSFNISEDSYRKGDHPAAFNYQPYYTHWKRVADHCARLCATLNAHSGVLVADVLCLYPAKSFYAEMKPSTSEMAEMVGTYFTHNSDCLFRQQLDFEYASEEMIVAARIDGDRISIKDGTFKVLLLGATTCVTLRFARFVKDFFDAGGKILATYSLPCKDASAGESEEIARIFKDIFNVDPVNVATRVKALAIHDFAVHENKNDAGGRAVFIEGPEKPPFSGGYYPLFESACKSLLPLAQRDLLLAKDDAAKHPAYIMTVHKAFGDKDLFFFANTSRTAAYDRVACTLRLRAGKVDLWDTETGEITPFNSWGIKDGKTVLDLSFAPYTSYLLCVTRPATPCIRDIPGKAPLPPVSSVIALDGEWETKLNMPNGAMLYLDWHSSYKVEAGRAWGYHSTRTFTHKFVAHDVRDIAPVKLVIEGLVGDYGWCKTTTDPLVGGDRAHFKVPGSVQVLVNGTKIPITFDFEFKYLDAYWIVLDITSHVKDGENEVQFACTTRNHETFHVVTDPWRLVGYFEVDEKDGVPELRKPRASVKLSDITGQGFPRYHGGFSYIKRVDVPAGTKKAVLKVAGTTDCVEVKVNGKLVDVAWHAWDVDITRSLNAGTTNTIELVHYGTAQNMLQTNIKPHGLTGTVSLEIFT